MHHAKLSSVDSHRISDKELEAHFESYLRRKDPGVLAAALGAIARVKGMSQLSRDSGISRATLYRVLSINGDPSLSIILKVAEALGIKVHIVVSTVSEAGGNARR